jgi:hypothetical protein
MQELRRDRDNAKVIRTLTKSMYFNPRGSRIYRTTLHLLYPILPSPPWCPTVIKKKIVQ